MALAFERAGVDVQGPAPVPGLVTKRAMVMSRIQGVSADDVEGVAAFGHPPGLLVRLAVVGVIETTFVEGIFHGDLHPGNILVNDKGLGLIDFGIMGRLTPSRRQSLLRFVTSAFAEDRIGIIASLKEFGALPDDLDPAAFVAQLPEPPTWDERMEIMRDRDAMRAAMGDRIAVILRALAAQGFRLPPELALFAKNIVYLTDAVQRHAPPDFDLVPEVTAVIDEVRNRFAELGGAG
jgi:ubiquinone biosynthesis protein